MHLQNYVEVALNLSTKVQHGCRQQLKLLSAKAGLNELYSINWTLVYKEVEDDRIIIS